MIVMAIVTNVIMSDHQTFNNNGNLESGIRCDEGIIVISIHAINQVID
jgi:hypothetical protein